MALRSERLPAAPPDHIRRSINPSAKWLVIGGLAVSTVIILLVLNPGLIFTATTPSGGDMGAHVLGPAFLRDELLPRGRIQGWSNSWFAGFPIFYFYFPLPSLVIVFLDLFLPYGVAFKIVTVIGLLALPSATYYFARAMGFGRAVAMVTGTAGAAFAFLENPTPQIFGGTIASTLAGEFSYSWSFALALVYLSLATKTIHEDRKYGPWAALFLALTALTHVLTTITAVIATLVMLFWKRGRRYVPLTWLLGFAVAAFWALPLLVRLNMTTDMNWQPLEGLDELLPPELWPILIAGTVGLVWSMIRTRKVAPFAVLTFLLPIGGFVELDQGSKLWNGRLLPHWFFGVSVFAGLAVGMAAVELARRLPRRLSTWWAQIAVGSFAVFMMTAAANARREVDVAGGQIEMRWLVGIVGAALIVGLFLAPARMQSATLIPAIAASLIIGAAAVGTVTEEAYVDGWARWNYSGYEQKGPFAEYQAVTERVAALGPGRVQWEANGELNQYGTPMALMLFPYWSQGANPSMEGLFFESSLTTPFHFLNAAELSRKPSNPIPGLAYRNFDFDRGSAHMQLFNVEYYVTFTEEARAEALSHPDFSLIAETTPFTIFELPESSLVDIARFEPWVYETGDSSFLSSMTGVFSPSEEPDFVDVALDWYDDLDLLDQWIVEEGPDDWARVTAKAVDDSEGLRPPTVEVDYPSERTPIATIGQVSDVEIEDERVSFSTTAIGVPHMVKVSYFPNWQVEGAEGPFRVSPSLMMVIPTQSDVTLQFKSTWAEKSGLALSILGIIGVVFAVRVTRRRVS